MLGVMPCAGILVVLLGTGILVVVGEVGLDSVNVWMEETDLCTSWSFQDSNGTCQCMCPRECVGYACRCIM